MSNVRQVAFVNRPNKDYVRGRLVDLIDLNTDALARPQDYAYVSLSGYRFVDLLEVYRRFRIRSLFSIESNPQIQRRSEFNRPYEWVQVFPGRLPDFIGSYGPALRGKKKILFLDYNSPLGHDVVQELDALFLSDFYETPGLLFVTLNCTHGSPTPYVKTAASRDFLRKEEFEAWLHGHIPSLVKSQLRKRFSGKDTRDLAAFVYKDTSPMMVFAFLIDDETSLSKPYVTSDLEHIAVPDMTPLEQHTLRRHSSKGSKQLASEMGIETVDVEFFLTHD